MSPTDMAVPPPINPAYLKSLEDVAARSMGAARNEIRDGQDAARAERTKTFYIDWTDPRGGQWRGTFTNHIITLGERESIGLMRAHGLKGLVFEQVPPSVWNTIWIVTHLQTSLDKRPEWAQDLWSLYDYELIETIYAEVTAHEATFCRAPQITQSGEGGTGDQQPVAAPVVRGNVQNPGDGPAVYKSPGG